MNFTSTSILARAFIPVASLALAACSTTSTPDAGQLISARGDLITARGKAWGDGQRDLRKGQKLAARGVERGAEGEKKLKRAQDSITDAQREIEEARADQVSGEQLIADANSRMQQAEAAYSAIRNGPSAVAPQ